MQHRNSYIKRLRRSGLSCIIATLAMLFQALLVVGHAGAVVTSTTGNLADDYPFGPLVICTPAGITIVSPDDATGDGQGNGGSAGVICSLCATASAPDVILVSFGGIVVAPVQSSVVVVWPNEDDDNYIIRRYSQKPARAPPVGLFI